MNSDINSQVLIHEHDPHVLEVLKQFCVDNQLIGIVDKSRDINSVLGRRINLGAIFLAEEEGSSRLEGFMRAQKIHSAHPELPIFLRRTNSQGMVELEEKHQRFFAACYDLDNMDVLESAIKEYVFNTHYPGIFVNKVQTTTARAIKSTLKDIDVEIQSAYISKDYRSLKDLSAYVPIESAWCKGYLSMHIMIDDVERIISTGKTYLQATEHPEPSVVNGWLSEVTNMVWGGIKRDLFSLDVNERAADSTGIAIPIVANRREGTFSVGADVPLICFKYLLCDGADEMPTITMVQKLYFHLRWIPEAIAGINNDVDDLVEDGEITFF